MGEPSGVCRSAFHRKEGLYSFLAFHCFPRCCQQPPHVTPFDDVNIVTNMKTKPFQARSWENEAEHVGAHGDKRVSMERLVAPPSWNDTFRSFSSDVWRIMPTQECRGSCMEVSEELIPGLWLTDERHDARNVEIHVRM